MAKGFFSQTSSLRALIAVTSVLLIPVATARSIRSQHRQMRSKDGSKKSSDSTSSSCPAIGDPNRNVNNDEISISFLFQNGDWVNTTSTDNTVYVTVLDDTFDLHVSCSDSFENGYGSKGGPYEEYDQQKVVYYSIWKYKNMGSDKCKLEKLCGDRNGLPILAPSASPSEQPTLSPSESPSSSPTHEPSTSPSNTPSHQPTNAPSMEPTLLPSLEPSGKPTTSPSSYPTDNPSASPSAYPSDFPTRHPSESPSYCPSPEPSYIPTTSPSSFPTQLPSTSPSVHPTQEPSTGPSVAPTITPTSSPSLRPSSTPSFTPSSYPSNGPTVSPTSVPSTDPTAQPSITPTVQPSGTPTRQPSGTPTRQPSSTPTRQPSSTPTRQPSSMPTAEPTSQPSTSPTAQPSANPSQAPSTAPSSQPSLVPSYSPTLYPTLSPSGQPTQTPSTYPSRTPSNTPTASPSMVPSSAPTLRDACRAPIFTEGCNRGNRRLGGSRGSTNSICGCQDSYAAGTETVKEICLEDKNDDQWGWSLSFGNGTYLFPLYAAAIGCDTQVGHHVGNVTVNFNADLCNVQVEYEVKDCFELSAVSVFLGDKEAGIISKPELTSFNGHTVGKFPSTTYHSKSWKYDHAKKYSFSSEVAHDTKKISLVAGASVCYDSNHI